MWVISYDLDSSIAGKHKTYSKISQTLLKMGFDSTQLSVYSTTQGLDFVYKAIEAIKNIKYVKDAVNDLQVFQMLEGSDFTNVIKT